MDLLNDLTNQKFVLVLLEEKQYFQELIKIVRRVEEKHEKICYVCLSKTYYDIIDELNRINLNNNKFFFIDTLSSHYKKPKPEKNCLFINTPSDLTALKVAVTKSIDKEKCSVVIFDTISALLVYQEIFHIVKMTHDLMTEKINEKSNTVFVVLKSQDKILKDLNKGLIGDLKMFADSTIDMGELNENDKNNKANND